MKFLVFADDSKSVAGLATKLRDKGEVSAVTLDGQSENCQNYGIKNLYVLKGKAFPDNVSAALSSMDLNSYDLIIISSSPLGREVAGILSAKLTSPAMTEVFDFDLSSDKLITKRFFFGGKTIMEEESNSKIITVTPGSFDAKEGDKTEKIETINLSESKITLMEVKQKEKSSTNIESANILVSVGRGIGKKESIESIMPLVNVTHGELAGSRPVCLDYKWLSEERQVGLSGKKVKPKVYIALGISGQIQHIAGMRGAKLVVAINKDRDAPIFQECDYGIVGDLFQIVPKLVEALKK
ncbi:electron transfer flavoprotein subunit alpha/FixB family protein [Cuniculiplasma sp. SKW3]|uniref:electron transfer flavoprotein subunit alpha/FixB family protein n=1 Tax=Cuniculiplasma sp. SKW3 TaxID=3400170 RepID=UPI003FD14F45